MMIGRLIVRHRAGETIDALAREIDVWPYALVRLFAEDGYAIPTKSVHLRTIIKRHFKKQSGMGTPPAWL